MEEYELQFIETRDEARGIAAEMFKKMSDAGASDEKIQKEMINQCFNKMFDSINSGSSSPSSKSATLMILVDIMDNSLRPETKLSKLFSILMTHKLFKQLQSICETVDPFKPVSQKGKSQYPSDPESGNNIVRCSLQIVKFLAIKFQNNKNHQPTAYRRSYNKLAEKKVIFPNDYKFLAFAPKGKEERVSGSKPPLSSDPQTPRPGKQSQFNFLCNRIKTFLQTLEEQDEEEQLHKEINKMHEIIKKEVQKLNNSGNDILQGTDSDLIGRIFEVKDFMDQQVILYDQFVDHKRDYNTYIRQVKNIGDKVFPKNSSQKKPEPEQRLSNLASKIGSEKVQIKSQLGNDSKAFNEVQNYFKRVEERSKSPISGGFKKITEQLSRQKSKNATVKSRVSPLGRSNFNKSINSLKQSKVAAIFLNPPNQNPPPRHYEGIEVPENMALNNLILKIDKNQGHRRFKTSNFKGKSSLFENENIQIGYKSEAIYEQISGFRVLLKIELFFGNLCEQNIRNLSLQFKGDQNVLLYCNPRTIDSTLVVGQQNKIQLAIIPLKPQFPLLTINVKYSLGIGPQQFQLILPNSALKFAHFLEITKSEFTSRWGSAELYKSSQFPLSHYLPPDTLSRWIPSLAQQVPYASFAEPGSKKDYELFSAVIMMQKYEALMKINIRPNLNAVIQIGVQDKNDEVIGYFGTFIQHMQQFMKEHK